MKTKIFRTLAKFFKKNVNIKNITNASLVSAWSLATRFFCFDKLPEFKIGPDILRREEFIEEKPAGWPSSLPVSECQKVHCINSNLILVKILIYYNNIKVDKTA